MDLGRVISDSAFSWCWPQRFGSLLLGAFVLAAGAPLHASIVLPELPTFELQSEETGASAPAEVAARDEQSDSPTVSDLLLRNLLHLGDAYRSLAPTASSPSVGLSHCACDLLAASPCFDLKLVGRITSQLALRLPIPPASRLLRPPQSC